jgi:predicted nuclease of restriction endonuclease-like (RecB) superfamily
MTLETNDYAAFLTDLKTRIRAARTKAALAVNRELVLLYWQIGQGILERLSTDLRAEFPDMQGFSRTNLKYMRMFAAAYPEFGQQPVDQLPWGHNIVLLSKLKDDGQREWYIRACIQNGWSRAVLEAQIATRLHERQGKAVHNFDRALPAPQSELAAQLLKDPYNFDFLSLGQDAHERDLERGLIVHLKKFLLELGADSISCVQGTTRSLARSIISR